MFALAAQPGGAPTSAQAALTPAQATAGSTAVHHYEYVFPVGEMYVYDIDEGQQLVQRVTGLPDTDGVRGVIASPAAHVLYIAHGGDGGGNGNGSLLAYDLQSEKVLWNRSYPFPVDSGAITPDGRTIYMPSGEIDPSGVWNVLDAGTGEPVGSVQGGAGAHNTIVSLDGKYVFLGGRSSNYLDVSSTATNTLVQRIGPLAGGVRPFTVDGSDTLAYTTATEYLGFQVSSIATGKVLYSVPMPGLPSGFPLSAPSHGIALTPDEQRLFVFDAPNDAVHVFDVSGVPARPPVQLTTVKVSSISEQESPCAYDCTKSGWLQTSRDGRFVYVGDAGDVIETATLKVVASLPALTQTREMLEIDWSNGVPAATTTRYGLGYVKQPRSIPATALSSPASGLSAPTTSDVSAPTISDASAPTIGGLSISPGAFAAVGSRRRHGRASGATVSYSDSQSARTRFTVLEATPGTLDAKGRCLSKRSRRARSVKRCDRLVAVAAFTRQDRAGRNRFRFSGSLHGRRLLPGRYRLQAVPSAQGRLGQVRAVSFRVVA